MPILEMTVYPVYQRSCGLWSTPNICVILPAHLKHGTQSKSMALSARHPEPLSDQYMSAPQRPAVFRHTNTTYIDRKE